MARKKTILVDFTRIGIAGGFGQICANFAPRLAKAESDLFRFVFLVKRGLSGSFGNKVGYAEVSEKEKLLPFLLPEADLWHATDQDFRYRRHAKGCKQLLTVHDLNFRYEKTPLKQKRYLRRLQSRVDGSDYLTAISHFTRNDIEAHIDLKGKRVEVIQNGIEDLSALRPQRPAFDNQAPFFFTIGQVRPKKNFHVLVEMMKAFPEHRLYICGPDNHPYAEKVREEIARCQLQDRVLLTGQISPDEKAWLYARCEAFLFPSFAEGFGLPVLEAMQFGKPVFASNSTSLPEVCGPYATLWNNYQPAYLARSVKDGMERFAADPRIARDERDYALSFNYDRYTERYMELYQEILFGEQAGKEI